MDGQPGPKGNVVSLWGPCSLASWWSPWVYPQPGWGDTLLSEPCQTVRRAQALGQAGGHPATGVGARAARAAWSLLVQSKARACSAGTAGSHLASPLPAGMSTRWERHQGAGLQPTSILGTLGDCVAWWSGNILPNRVFPGLFLLAVSGVCSRNE